MDRPESDPPLPLGSAPSHSDDAPTIAASDAARRAEDAPTIQSGSMAQPAPRKLPATIGPYRILGVLGEGGMGVVFEAEQDQPRRRVALKVIRGGLFVDESYVRMFQREVDTLARLKHANIADIYDAGRTETGESYFAMELVRGQNLDAYLRSRTGPLDDAEVRFRLRLFQVICSAVNYAHQRGVIHRDLKPSNIIVSVVDGSGAGPMPDVKVLDFGLARLTHADADAPTAMSEIGVIKGTLPYMSPEQARGNPDDLDIRSDVYALGVILYEMLTGARPYDTQNVSIMESVRIICEQPPLALRQAWRGTRAPDVDLQTISNKSLEKEADRRYESAAALSDDIGRYLESRPILARAPSRAYQLRKFAQRNRVLVAGVAATLLALIAGIIVSTNFGLREAAQRRAAEQAEKDTQAVAEFQQNMLANIDAQAMGSGLADDLAARLQKARADKGAPPAAAAADVARLRDYLGAMNTTDAALRVIDKNILERAITTSTAQFATRPELRATLLNAIGSTYMKLGMFDRAEAPLVASHALLDSVDGPSARQTLVGLRLLGDLAMVQGRSHEAESLFVLALHGQQRAFGAGDSDVTATTNDLAETYGDLGRLGTAESLYAIAIPAYRARVGIEDRNLLTMMGNYAWELINDEKFAPAESIQKHVLMAWRKLDGNEGAMTLTAINNLGVLYMRSGRIDEAEPLYREDYETCRRVQGDEHPDVLVSMTNLGRLLNARKKFAEAEALLARALVTSQKVLPPGFPGTGITMLAHAEALMGLHREHEAEPQLVQARAILLAALGPQDGAVLRADKLLAQVHGQVAATSADR